MLLTDCLGLGSCEAPPTGKWEALLWSVVRKKFTTCGHGGQGRTFLLPSFLTGLVKQHRRDQRLVHQFLLYLILIFLLFLPLGRRFFSSTLNFPAKVNSPCFLPLNKRAPVGEDIGLGREIMFGMLYSGQRDGTRLREGGRKVSLVVAVALQCSFYKQIRCRLPRQQQPKKAKMLILGDFTYKENEDQDSRCSTLGRKVLGVLNEYCLHCHDQNSH